MSANKGKIRTEEYRRKMSIAKKGKKYPNRKRPKPFTEEHKRKIGIGSKGNKHSLGYKWTEEQKNNIRGRKQSQETIKKRFLWKKNYKISEETKNKMREANKKWEHPSKENHYNWQGGKSLEEYGEDWTDCLRESIRKRDGFECQICGLHQDELSGLHKKLAVHHIDYIKKNLDPNNLITLCRSCHTKTNYNRNYWINYFKNFYESS